MSRQWSGINDVPLQSKTLTEVVCLLEFFSSSHGMWNGCAADVRWLV